MKYPLRLIEMREAKHRLAIADAAGLIVCTFADIVRAREFAEFVVRAANRWHRWRPWFRAYTRADWLWERNPWRN